MKVAGLSILLFCLNFIRASLAQQQHSWRRDWSLLGAEINGVGTYNYGIESPFVRGQAVSLSANGTIVAYGAPGDDDGGIQAGTVRVFQLRSGAWVQMGSDIDGKAPDEFAGYSVSLSSDGTTVAVGAPRSNGLTGKVRVFKYESGDWSQLGAAINGRALGDISGFAVSISADGNIVAIGSLGSNNNRGQVRVFQYTTGNWVQMGADINGDAPSVYLVWCKLSADGLTVAVGAPYSNNEGGRVRVLKYLNASWTQIGANINGFSYSGYSVGLSANGSIVAVGSHGYNKKGHVKIYQYANLGGWIQLGNAIEGTSNEDLLGVSLYLSASGLIIALGGPYNKAGKVLVYEFVNNSWTQTGSIITGVANGDKFGLQLSLSSDGSILAVGAPGSDAAGVDAGQVRVFELVGATTYTYEGSGHVNDIGYAFAHKDAFAKSLGGRLPFLDEVQNNISLGVPYVVDSIFLRDSWVPCYHRNGTRDWVLIAIGREDLSFGSSYLSKHFSYPLWGDLDVPVFFNGSLGPVFGRPYPINDRCIVVTRRGSSLIPATVAPTSAPTGQPSNAPSISININMQDMQRCVNEL